MDNKKALGYLLLACKELGLSKQQTKELYDAMYRQFDLKTEDQAEMLGFEWYYDLQAKVPGKFKWATPTKAIIFPKETRMSQENKALLKKIKVDRQGL